MGAFWTALVFLVGVYWPYLLAAMCIGIVTGWLSLSRSAGDKGAP